MRSLAPVLLLLSVPCLAQEGAPAPPKPAPEMKVLTDWVGTWDTEEKHGPSPWLKEVSKGQGVVVYELGPGGYSVISKYKSKSGPFPGFEGQGIMTWDPEQKVYRSYWMDVMTPGVAESKGRREGDNLVFTSEMVIGPQQKAAMKEVISDITPKSFTSTVYMDGKVIMTFRYKKRS